MDVNKIMQHLKLSDNTETYLSNLLEEIRSEERSKTQEKFFELAIDMLCVSNMNGYFTKVSKSFTKVLGYSEEELISRPFKDFVVEDDQIKTDGAYDQLLEGTPLTFNFENRYRCKDGSIKWLSWRCVSIPAEEIIYGIARDVTEQKIVEEFRKGHINELEELINQKNTSLKYARYLQDGIIPGEKNLSQVFPDSFVFNLPREIVSGDFCWVQQCDDIVMVAAADCTGHGVPGAMMTMVCTSLLNRAVKEFFITEPGKILDKVRELLLSAFSGSGTEMNDGMDISLCCINTKSFQVQWSGANNPLLYVNDKKLVELAPDKQPIGRFDSYKNFSTHTFNLKKGDMLYLFSDGYADQFGGEKGKKFMYKQLYLKLEKLHLLSTKGQKERLQKVFEEWKGRQEQVDDVLVIGIKL